jgi:hypothetical protein
MTERIDMDTRELTVPHHASHETLTWWGPVEARAAAEIRPMCWAARWDGEPFGYADIVLLVPYVTECLVVMTRAAADPDMVALGDLRSSGHDDVADLLAKEVAASWLD